MLFSLEDCCPERATVGKAASSHMHVLSVCIDCRSRNSSEVLAERKERRRNHKTPKRKYQEKYQARETSLIC